MIHLQNSCSSCQNMLIWKICNSSLNGWFVSCPNKTSSDVACVFKLLRQPLQHPRTWFQICEQPTDQTSSFLGEGTDHIRPPYSFVYFEGKRHGSALRYRPFDRKLLIGVFGRSWKSAKKDRPVRYLCFFRMVTVGNFGRSCAEIDPPLHKGARQLLWKEAMLW